MTTFELVFLGALGAMSQEVLHVSGFRHSLREPGVRERLRDPLFWLIGLMVVLVSTGIAYVWFDGTEPARKLDVFMVGAAAPALFKQAVTAVSNSAPLPGHFGGPKLGGSQSRHNLRSLMQTYFRIG